MSEEEEIIRGFQALARMFAKEVAAELNKLHSIEPSTVPPPEASIPATVPRPGLDRYITSKELAGHLGLPVGSVWRLSREGKIPALKLGRCYRFDLAAVIHALTECGMAD